MSSDNINYLRDYFAQLQPMYLDLVESMTDDAAAVLERAATIWEEMIPDMAYADDRDHPMAVSVFGCSVALAVFLALREEGVSEHRFGAAFLTQMQQRIAALPERQPEQDGKARERLEKLIQSGAASQRQTQPGEFVFEARLSDSDSDNDGADWTMNIHSCGICHAFSRHDAMALVPYMCATDDVMSDWGNQGLVRTGTIAVGAHHCDFRYQRGREPDHLSRRYPDLIRLENL